MTDVNKIKEKLAALLARARDAGSSEAEVAACMARAQKMMETYSISEEDLDKVTADDFVERDFYKREGAKNISWVDRYLGGAIAKLTGTVASTDGHVVTYHGLMADVEFAVWLRNSMLTFMADQWETYKMFNTAGMSRDQIVMEKKGFIRGFVEAIQKRIYAMINEASPIEGKGTALVAKKQEVVKAHYAANGKRFSGTYDGRGAGVASASGAAAGYSAGMAASMGRGVSQGAIAIGKA